MAFRVRLHVCAWVVFALALVAPAVLHSQETAAPATALQTENPPVFHATARLVLLDVVVSDKQHAFVPGLKAGDFTVLEDGKPQSLSGFAAHVVPAGSPRTRALPSLPPHQYTNFLVAAQALDLPMTIVLLDMLNTSGQGQQFARKQMVEFLKTLPPGRPVALFTLTSTLHMVQGPTGDSTNLIKAATAVLAKTPLLASPEAETQQDEVTARTLETMNGPINEGPTGDPEPVGGEVPHIIPAIGQGIRNALAAQDSLQRAERMAFTVSALEVMARAVAGYPGRKNLLWLAADFPVTFGPNLDPYSQANGSLKPSRALDINPQVRDLRFAAPPIEQTAALLTAAQMAVYPIDVSGLANTGTGIDISTSTNTLSSFDLGNEAQTATFRQRAGAWDTHEAMGDIARQTGGHAFYGNNDVKYAMTHAMDEGSSYYTLAYVPANHDFNGKYRKLEVKIAHPGVQLTYRRGYYPLPEAKAGADRAAAAMASALKLAVPEYTMLLMKVQVLPPDGERKTVSIDYAVDARDIAFAEGPDQRKLATVDFVATAWDRDLKLVAHKADTMSATLRPEPFQQVMTSGLPFHQELELNPGSYTIRVGVLDRNNQKIGTVDVPLTIPGPTLGSNITNR